MVALTVLITITALFLTFFLIRELRKTKNLSKENEGLRYLTLNKELNLAILIESGLPIESIAIFISYKIQFLIESGAKIDVVLDMMDEIGISQKVTLPVGKCSDIDSIRIRIQEIISERFHREGLQNWVDANKLVNEKTITRLDSSFLRSIPKSMLVWSPLD